VKTRQARYPVLIGSGILSELGAHLSGFSLSRKIALISDTNVAAIYSSLVQDGLEAAGFSVNAFWVPAGEESKTLDQAAQIYTWLIENKIERRSAIVALGGGVVGDLAGFVAATFLRGVPLIHLPTSLVAQVDSSIGGKVGVNHPLGKNLIGAFYQPELVFIDTETLGTLPRRELTSGWAEVIKYGMIADDELFSLLEGEVRSLKNLETEILNKVIRTCVQIKARVVEQDEREVSGYRMILNYGHTLGHALEAATGYQRFLHGEAVAIGMEGAARIATAMGLISEDILERQRRLIEAFSLPISYSDVALEAIQEAMSVDKKVAEEVVRWVLPVRVGAVVIRKDVPGSLVEKVMAEMGKS